MLRLWAGSILYGGARINSVAAEVVPKAFSERNEVAPGRFLDVRGGIVFSGGQHKVGTEVAGSSRSSVLCRLESSLWQ
jgi:hypothetical protein